MVQFTTSLGLIFAGAVLVSAAPAPAPTAAPNLAKRASSATSCTFSDAAAASKSQASCATIVLDNIAVPSGTTLDLTDLTDGTAVVFSGTTTFGYEEWSGPLISIAGTDIVVSGASGHEINGGGEQWWDGEGTNGGKTKPKFFYAHKLLGSSSITGLNIVNTPVQAFSINGATGLTVADITIDNTDGNALNSDGDALGHNTDAFDVGSSDSITITGANIKNQDDCLAINSGTNIVFSGATCSGGHGISIGSVGGRTDNTVDTVTVSDCTISDSTNGVRIKTVYDATGAVSGVTYKDITLENITDYGIVIQQDYKNGSPTGTPTDGVPITGLTLTNVKGTVTSDGTNIHVLCAACSDWTWTSIDVTGGATSTECTGEPSGITC